jgi:hypothetical protein
MPYYPPYYYYPPQGALPAILPQAMLPFEEGQTIPPGYELKARPVRSMVIAGSITFGVTYLISILTASTVIASDSNDGKKFGPMFVPAIGPFITIGTTKSDGAGTLWLVLDGLAQTAGGAMLVYGLVAEEKFLERKATEKTSALFKLTHPEVRIGPRAGLVKWTF